MGLFYASGGGARWQCCECAAVEDVNGDGEIARDGTGDEDGDGLTEFEEINDIGTDPCLTDTDGCMMALEDVGGSMCESRLPLGDFEFVTACQGFNSPLILLVDA